MTSTAEDPTETMLVMTATAPATITDKSGTKVDAPTIEDVHHILRKSAQLGGGIIQVQQPSQDGTRYFHFHSDGTVDEPQGLTSAEWSLEFHPWTIIVEGQKPFRVPTQAAVCANAQELANKTGGVVQLIVRDLIPSHAGPQKGTYTPQISEARVEEAPQPLTDPVEERHEPTDKEPPSLTNAMSNTSATDTPSDIEPTTPLGQPTDDVDRFTVLGHHFDLDDLIDIAPAQKGFAGFMNVLTGGSLKKKPGYTEARERREAAELARCEQIIRQATWARGSVAFTVANKKGNAGKTPLTVSVCGMIASIRGGSVAMMEVSDDPGQLARRSEGNPQRGVGELVVNADHIRTKAQLEGYTVPQTSFAHSFGSSPHRRAPLNSEAIHTAAALIDQFYTLRALDSGNVYTSSAFTGAMETSDALLIPTMNATDSMSEAVELFHYLESHEDPHFRDLATRAIIVRISDGRPEYKLDRMINDLFNQTGITPDRMFTLPYDAHIAERGPITLSKLAPATKTALLRISAALITQLQSPTTRE